MITLWATFTSNGGYFSFQHLVTLIIIIIIMIGPASQFFGPMQIFALFGLFFFYGPFRGHFDNILPFS